VATVAGAALALAVGACESTQEKAERLRAEGGEILDQEGLSIDKANKGVEVLETAVLQDEYGTAVAVQLENTTGEAMLDVPIAIDVRGKGGESLFRNDTPGIEPALTSLAVLPARRSVWWVNNQVVATSPAKEVDVKVGAKRAAAPEEQPEIRLSDLGMDSDTDGPFATGVVENHSDIPQKRLTIFAVAREGGEVVAAGRAVIDRLEPHPTPKPVRFSIYFIGNPKGAELELYAPPVELQ
jgi:hypothetical protein